MKPILFGFPRSVVKATIYIHITRKFAPSPFVLCDKLKNEPIIKYTYHQYAAQDGKSKTGMDFDGKQQWEGKCQVVVRRELRMIA